MIHTREQLINKLMDIVFKWHSKNNSQMDYLACSNEIADLISTLNDEDEDDVLKGTRHKSEAEYLWKNIP